MENNESNPKIIIRLLILEIFPSLEELNNNNSEITISFQDKDNDIIFNLNDILTSKKELELPCNYKSSSIKIIINKNDILYASGLLQLKNGEQWVTLTYENKKRQINSNLALSLMDCIKLKINCKIISGTESINISENKINNIIKKNKQILNQKKKTSQKKFDINYMTQCSFNNEENQIINRYIEPNINTPTTSPLNVYTTINKNNFQKIELSSNNSNNLNKRKINKFKNIQNLTATNPFNPKKSQKIINKKSEEGEIIGLLTEIKPKAKNRGNKRSLDKIHLNLNSNNKKNISSTGIKNEHSKSNKIMKKRKSGGIQQVNLIGKLYDNNQYIMNKNDFNKKKSSDNIKKNSLQNSKKKFTLKNLTESNEIINNNDQLLNMVDNYNNNIDSDEIIINHDVENIQNDNIIFQNNNKENKIKRNNIINLIDDEIYDENDIFFKQLEDFKLLYSNEYLKTISNEYIKLEIELFIEKVLELVALYNNQIEEKYFEYQIEKNNYYKNIFQFIEIQKLFNKLNIMKYQFQLKKDNMKIIKSSHINNSINNLITNKKQINIFKNNLLEENQKKINYKKEIIKQIIKKLIEKEKNKNILEKNEKFKIWIKNNCLKGNDKKKKEKKNQKYESKKKLNNLNTINNNDNYKQLIGTYNNNTLKKKTNKIENEIKGKNKIKK